MEVIDKPIVKVDVDDLAKRVFYESINILGGLKRLIEYRNLTWLPSLAQASYAVVLHKEFLLSYDAIAQRLGLTKQTVKNILTADEGEVKRFLEGELEKVDEHKAGGIAKLAYKAVKEKKDLYLSEDEIKFIEEGLKEVGKEWAIHVLMRLKGVKFPLDRELFIERLGDLVIEGKAARDIAAKIEFPLKNPAEVLHAIKVALGN